MERNKGNILVKRTVIVVDFAILNFGVAGIYSAHTRHFASSIRPVNENDFFRSQCIDVHRREHVLHHYPHQKGEFHAGVQAHLLLERTGFHPVLSFHQTPDQLWRTVLLQFAVFCSFYVILVISRALELEVLKYFRTKGYNSRTAIFVGNDPAVLDMYNTLVEDPSAGYRVNGYFADADIVGAPKEFVRLGNLTELNKIVDSSINNTIHGAPTNMHEMFCCLSHDQSKEVIRLMQYCDKNVIHFYYLPRQFEGYKLHLDALQFMGKSLYTNHIEPLSNTTNRVIKRSFDLGGERHRLPVHAAIHPHHRAHHQATEPPAPSSSVRTERASTARPSSALNSARCTLTRMPTAQATEHDPRKFAFGNFMRKTNIDEFPQFLNVLRGEMSIVGPRPHMLHHTEIYGTIINKYMVRHFAKPGITGWAQVTGYRGETKELWQMEERVRRDIWYLENWSFWPGKRIKLLPFNI